MANPTKESTEFAAAREEMEVLESLAEGVSAQIVELSKRPQFHGKIDNVELALQENKYARLKAYEELAHNCYARTVKGTEVDDKDRPRGAFTYRITQANVGYVDNNCFVLARNSRLASELVTAQPGDERDVTTQQRDRYLNVGEVRTFEGPVNLRSPTQKPNFRSMAIRRIGLKRPVVLEDLRSVVHGLKPPVSDAESFPPQSDLASSSDDDPTWLGEGKTRRHCGAEIDHARLEIFH